jgi:uncharacterized protein
MYTQSEVLAILKADKAMLQQQYGLVRIGLFGSYAKGVQTPESDLDIIVEYEDGAKKLLEKRLALEDYLRLKFRLPVDVAREKYIRPRLKQRILSYAIFV